MRDLAMDETGLACRAADNKVSMKKTAADDR